MEMKDCIFNSRAREKQGQKKMTDLSQGPDCSQQTMESLPMASMKTKVVSQSLSYPF